MRNQVVSAEQLLGTAAARAGERPARSRASSTRYGERPARAPLVAAPGPRVARAILGGAARGLSLAAAPTFAVMALLTGAFGGGMPDILCSAAQGASPLSGMALMYLLMSAFHLAPWLKLITA